MSFQIRKTLAILVAGAVLSFSFQAVMPTMAVEMGEIEFTQETKNIQEEGVGNPYEFGERYFEDKLSVDEMIAKSAEMSKRKVKYSLYKEIDEHWEDISKALRQPCREKVYALFCGFASRESTLDASVETAQDGGFGVNSAHAYGPLQTAVTAFADCDPTFMPEEDVPELFQYTFIRENFYDPIISNHMGIRKLIHFIREGERLGTPENQLVRNALKGFNTGWATPTDEGGYVGYADEIAAMGKWYYEQDHLYDQNFTWTGRTSTDRTDPWGWWFSDKVIDRDAEPEEGVCPVKLQVINNCPGNEGTSMMTEFQLVSATTATVKLENLKIRYYFSSDGCEEYGFDCHGFSHEGQKLDQNTLTAHFEKLTGSNEKADQYLELGFTKEAGNLIKGETTIISTRTYRKDWQNCIMGNDYSYVDEAIATTTDKVTVYYNGKLVFGVEPEGTKGAEIVVSTPTPPISTPSITPSDSPTNILKGDLDGDGKVNILDARLMKRCILNGMGDVDIQVADLDGDEEINVIDARLLKKMILGI